MPLRIRFNGAVTNNTVLTINWNGGYPPGAITSATETFKNVITSTYFQVQTDSSPVQQAINFYDSLYRDYRANFTITRIENDVIINPKNGSVNITGTASNSTNIVFNPSLSRVQSLGRPQSFTPVYNPVTFKFFSNNYSMPGHRYLINVYKTSEYTISPTQSTPIASFKVTPQIDGTGYVDISKQLSNFTTVDFVPGKILTSNCTNSYIDATVGIGEEFSTYWQFSQILKSTTGTFSNLIILNQSPTVTPHTYVVGDQINIDTTVTGIQEVVNGLHTVMSVPNSYSVIIDSTNPISGTVSTDGITSYADGRKTSYTNDITTSITAFNGVRTWQELPDWLEYSWYIVYASGDENIRLLTSLNPCPVVDRLYITPEEDRFYMTPDQSIYLNVATDRLDIGWNWGWEAFDQSGSSLGGDLLPLFGNDNGTVKQFMVSMTAIGESGALDDGLTNVDMVRVAVYDDYDNLASGYYNLYLDKRCKVEDYEVYFMDRMGSILSYAFQLGAQEKGTITRESSKQSVYYNENSSNYKSIYNTWERGTSINSVNLVKEIELNTNWMTNEMSVLFEELLTSPFTYLKINGGYVACTINETSFDVQLQKKKRLIRKTITVKMANENIINI